MMALSVKRGLAIRCRPALYINSVLDSMTYLSIVYTIICRSLPERLYHEVYKRNIIFKTTQMYTLNCYNLQRYTLDYLVLINVQIYIGTEKQISQFFIANTQRLAGLCTFTQKENLTASKISKSKGLMHFNLFGDILNKSEICSK